MLKTPTKLSGFTLIELIMALAIAGIVMMVGIPTFNSTITNNRMTTQANQFMTSLMLARSEAVKRNSQVTMLRTGAQWENGWIIFVDSNGDNAFNDDGDANLCETNGDCSPSEDCLLKSFPGLPTGFTLRTGASNYQNYAAFLPTGFSSSVIGDTFRLCDGSADVSRSRAIAINAAGRPRVSKGTAVCP